jgi:hypothetical protein
MPFLYNFLLLILFALPSLLAAPLSSFSHSRRSDDGPGPWLAHIGVGVGLSVGLALVVAFLGVPLKAWARHRYVAVY